MRTVIASDSLLCYPDHINKTVHSDTEVYDFQLGAVVVIIQENQPAAYFSRKSNPAQRNHSKIEKELLSIV